MTSYIQVLTAVEHRDDGEKIAATLLEKRLAACVQIGGPIISRYWWKGRVETAEEWVCTIKTRAGLYADVEREIKAAHPYEAPEIIALPILTASPQYLSWITDSTPPSAPGT